MNYQPLTRAGLSERMRVTRQPSPLHLQPHLPEEPFDDEFCPHRLEEPLQFSPPPVEQHNSPSVFTQEPLCTAEVINSLQGHYEGHLQQEKALYFEKARASNQMINTLQKRLRVGFQFAHNQSADKELAKQASKHSETKRAVDLLRSVNRNIKSQEEKMKNEISKLMNCNRHQKSELSSARQKQDKLEKELNAAEQQIAKITTSRKLMELEARKNKELLQKYKREQQHQGDLENDILLMRERNADLQAELRLTQSQLREAASSPTAKAFASPLVVPSDQRAREQLLLLIEQNRTLSEMMDGTSLAQQQRAEELHRENRKKLWELEQKIAALNRRDDRYIPTSQSKEMVVPVKEFEVLKLESDTQSEPLSLELPEPLQPSLSLADLEEEELPQFSRQKYFRDMQRETEEKLRDLKDKISNKPVLLRNMAVRRFFRLDMPCHNQRDAHIQYLNATAALFYIRSGKRDIVQAFYRWRTKLAKARELRKYRPERLVPPLRLQSPTSSGNDEYRTTPRYAQTLRPQLSLAPSTARTEKPDFDRYGGLESARSRKPSPPRHPPRRPMSARGRVSRVPRPKSQHLGQISSHIHQLSAGRMGAQQIRQFKYNRAGTPSSRILKDYKLYPSPRLAAQALVYPRQEIATVKAPSPPRSESPPVRLEHDAFVVQEVTQIHKNMRSKLVRDIYRKYLAAVDLAEQKGVKVLPIFERTMLALRSQRDSELFASMLQSCQSLKLLQHFGRRAPDSPIKRLLDDPEMQLDNQDLVNLVYNQDLKELDTAALELDFTVSNPRTWIAASLYKIKQNQAKTDRQLIANIFRLLTLRYRIQLAGGLKVQLEGLFKEKIEQRVCEALGLFLQNRDRSSLEEESPVGGGGSRAYLSRGTRVLI